PGSTAVAPSISNSQWPEGILSNRYRPNESVRVLVTLPEQSRLILTFGSALPTIVRTIPDRAATPAGPCSGGGCGSSFAFLGSGDDEAASLLAAALAAVVKRISVTGRLNPWASATAYSESVYDVFGRSGSSGVMKASIPASAGTNFVATGPRSSCKVNAP